MISTVMGYLTVQPARNKLRLGEASAYERPLNRIKVVLTKYIHKTGGGRATLVAASVYKYIRE
jgi:hypothetical protein